MAISVSAARTGAGSSGSGVGGRSSASVSSARRPRAPATTASAASAASAPIIPYQSRQLAKASGQDATLRSALAFVVLRRRLAAAAAAAAPNHGVVVDLTAGPGRRRSRGDENNPKFRGKVLAPASTPAMMSPLPRRPVVPDKSHVSHLVRLAITTALPLGDDVLGIGAGAGSSGRRGPVVYDHRLASSRGIGGTSTTSTARQLAILDGLLTHLSAQLSIVARASPGDARAIVRREFLDILLVKADAFEYRSTRSGNSSGGVSDDIDGRLIFSGEEGDDYNYYGGDGNDNPTAASARLLLDRTKLVLAVCTVLHRLIVCGADSETIPAAIVGGASSYLRHVYDGSYPDGFDVGTDDGDIDTGGANANGVGAGRRGRKKVSFQEDDDEDDDEDEDKFTTITAQVISLPRIGDTVAVNLLILLEEVGLTTHYRSYHGRPLHVSSSGNVILGALRGGFGQDLTLSPPLTVTSDAAMFVREEELRIIAEIRRRKRRMKRKKSGAAGAGAGADAMGAGSGTVNYVPLLDPGAKLMLRLALWDLVEKLSV